MKRVGWRLVLAGFCLLSLIAFAPVWAHAPPAVTPAAFTGGVEGNADNVERELETVEVTVTRFQPTTSPASNADGGGAVATGTESDLPALAQITETPAPYPSAGDETAPAMPDEATRTPAGSYPAGTDITGSDRVGADDQPILGNEPDNDVTDEANVTAQVEESGLGSFILWFGFLFGLGVFIAGVIFSIFLSARDRRTGL